MSWVLPWQPKSGSGMKWEPLTHSHTTNWHAHKTGKCWTTRVWLVVLGLQHLAKKKRRSQDRPYNMWAATLKCPTHLPDICKEEGNHACWATGAVQAKDSTIRLAELNSPTGKKPRAKTAVQVATAAPTFLSIKPLGGSGCVAVLFQRGSCWILWFSSSQKVNNGNLNELNWLNPTGGPITVLSIDITFLKAQIRLQRGDATL